MDAIVLELFLKFLALPIGSLLVSSVFLYFAYKTNLLEKKVIIYLPLFVLGISLFGLLGVLDVYFMPYTFVVVEVMVQILGLVNYLVLRRMKSDLESSLGKFLLLLVPQVLLSWALFSVFFNLTNSFQYGFFSGMVVWALMVVPLFLYAYQAYLLIPVEVYKVREFGSDDDFSAPIQALGTEDLLVCEIELYRRQGDRESIRIKAKAKADMVVGDWFGLVVSDYNQQAAGRTVELNGDAEKYGWIFYVKPSFFSVRRYIDPDATFVGNRLKEKDLIVAKRVKNLER